MNKLKIMNIQIFNQHRVLCTVLLPIVLCFCSCQVSVRHESGNKTADHLETVLNSADKIRNQIQWEGAGGLQVVAAFLMSEEGALIDNSNLIEPGSRIQLILRLSGWELVDNKVQVGVGQQLTNSNGKLLTRNNDIFEGSGPVSGEDAKVFTLSIEVLNTTTIYPYYKADFKIWNKNASQYVRGSYQFRLKNN